MISFWLATLVFLAVILSCVEAHDRKAARSEAPNLENRSQS